MGVRALLAGAVGGDEGLDRVLAQPSLAQQPEHLRGRALLAHGDAYCTLDEPYQRFRAQARDPAYQRQFLGRALAERRALIGQARALLTRARGSVPE